MSRIWLLAGLMFAVVSLPARSDDIPLVIVTEEWPPYNYTESGRVTGFATELVREIMSDLKVDHPIKSYPGARGHRMLDTMPNVLNFALFRTPERENKYQWIGPIANEAIYFYKRKGDSKIYQALEDLRQARNITTSHKGLVSNRVQEIAAEMGLTNILLMTNMKAEMQLVLVGKADLNVHFTDLGVVHYLKSIGEKPDGLVKTRLKLMEFPLHIAASKEIPTSVIQSWQNALEEIRASGRYREIYETYARP